MARLARARLARAWRLCQAWRVARAGWLAVPVLLTRTVRLGTGRLRTALPRTGGIGTGGTGRLGRDDRLT